MASEKIKHMLTDEGLREARGELAAFFRKITREIKMNPNKWEYLLNCYLEKYEKSTPKNSKDRSYARGNLNTQFTAPSMTWRTFMDGIRFLNPARARLTFEFDWGNRQYSKHSMTLRMRRAEDEISVMDDPSANPPASSEGEEGIGETRDMFDDSETRDTFDGSTE